MNIFRLMLQKTSIKSRMIISLTVILAAAFVITNLLNYTFSHTAVRQNLMNSVLPLTRDNIYSEIQAQIARPIFISSLMANDTFLKDWAISGEKDKDLIRKYLKTIKDKYDFFSVFFVSEQTGNYYHYTGILKKISQKDPHDIWFYNFKKLDREYDLDVDTDEAGGNKLTIFINHRLNGYNGKLLGVTGVGLNLERIAEMIKSYNCLYRCNIYLTDRAGTIQLHSDRKLIESTNIRSIPGLSALSEKILSGTGESALHEFESGEKKILLTSRIIPEFDWFLFVEIDEQTRMESIIKNIQTNIVLGIIISLLILSIAIITVNHFQSKLTLMAVTDELTGAYNRKELAGHIRKALYSFNRNHVPFSIILFDIDHFKHINDTRGHNEGDRVLKTICDIANGSKRLTDLLVRWGGDEFILLTSAGINDSAQAAERLRKLVAAYNFAPDNTDNGKPSFHVTISCGVSGHVKGDTIDSVISRADTALYRAKAKGRNSVEIELPSAEKPVKKTRRRHE